MKLAYVAGRYRAPTIRGIVENIQAAERVALNLWRLGYAVICPHKNTALFDGAAPDDVWLRGDLVMLGRCDLLVTVPGWETSVGSHGEVDFANMHEIPVYHWPEHADELGKIAAAVVAGAA